MSKHSDEFTLDGSLSIVSDACSEAVADLGWRILDQEPGRIVVKEVAPKVTSFTWPAQIEILIWAGDDGETVVSLDGEIFGLGPVQSGHLKGQVGALRNKIEVIFRRNTSNRPSSRPSSAPPTSNSLADELTKLKTLYDVGALSSTEFEAAKQRLLNPS